MTLTLMMAGQRPAHVGILAVEVYFPSQAVSMEAMEAADGCRGKYTDGLGQAAMAFCSDREDAVSMALSVARSLMQKYGVAPHEIGHLQVGTESSLDRSKSIKSHLLRLFTPPPPLALPSAAAATATATQQDVPGGQSGAGPAWGCGAGRGSCAVDETLAPDAARGPPEGVDCVHGCYGATAAVLAAAAWVECSRWDGRLALVVASDVAVYPPGSPARATGGCGAAAILVGPDAPLAIDPLWHATHAEHSDDFCKPVGGHGGGSGEAAGSSGSGGSGGAGAGGGGAYPVLDGPLSVAQYLRAVGQCACRLHARLRRAGALGAHQGLLPHVDHFVAHAPFGKLARKALARIAYMDVLRMRGQERRCEGAAGHSGSAAAAVAIAAAAGVCAGGSAGAAGGLDRLRKAPAAAGSVVGMGLAGGGSAMAAALCPKPSSSSSSSTRPAQQHEQLRTEGEEAACSGSSGPAEAGRAGAAHTLGASGPRTACQPAAAGGGGEGESDADGIARGDDCRHHHHAGHAHGGAAAVGVGVGNGDGVGAGYGLLPPELLEADPDDLPEARLLQDKAVDGALLKAAAGLWQAKGSQGAWLQQQVGNTYTACLWQGLASVLSRGAGGSNGGEALAGRRLLLFSFGSGTVASLLGLVARGSCGGGGDGEDGGCSDGRRQHGGDGNGVHDGGHVGGGAAAGPPKAVEGGGEGGVEGGAEGQQGLPRGPGADPRFTLSRMAEVLDLEARLQARSWCTVQQYNESCLLVEAAFAARPPFTPKGDLQDVAPGAYYLEGVDGMWRRAYALRAG